MSATPTMVTVLADDHGVADSPPEVAAELAGGRVLVDAAGLPDVLGWTLKPEGLCRAEVCVPVRDRDAVVAPDGRVDLLGVAGALDRPALFDEPSGVLAIGSPRADRRQALSGRRTPEVALPDLDGELHPLEEYLDRRVTLVAFASWCGCACDLPGWQALHDELADPAASSDGKGHTVVAVAIDDSPDDVRPFAEGITMPVLIDREHTLTEKFAISNVPTVISIEAGGRIAKPNWVAFGSDTFADFTGVESEPQLDAIRRWVRTGEVDVEVDDAEAVVGDLSEDELAARLRFRIGAHLRRVGDAEGAERNLAEAVRLAPHDWTVRRAAMPLRGVSPFGEEFFEMAAEWEAAGRPYHGIAAEQRVLPEADEAD